MIRFQYDLPTGPLTHPFTYPLSDHRDVRGERRHRPPRRGRAEQVGGRDAKPGQQQSGGLQLVRPDRPSWGWADLGHEAAVPSSSRSATNFHFAGSAMCRP
jgi:hypothetical protein